MTKDKGFGLFLKEKEKRKMELSSSINLINSTCPTKFDDYDWERDKKINEFIKIHFKMENQKSLAYELANDGVNLLIYSLWVSQRLKIQKEINQ